MDIRAIGSQSMLEIKPATHKQDMHRLRPAAPDDIRTSKKFMMLSENLPTLRKHLMSRESVVEQHTKTMKKMPKLSNEDIDRIIDQL